MLHEINQNQIISLKSQESKCMIELIMQTQQKYLEGDLLFFYSKESSPLKSDLEEIKQQLPGFDWIYNRMRFMFLKDSWTLLDEAYSKTFFINEIQKIMEKEPCETLYFHRVDTIFDGCSHKDMERILSDIIEVARYYDIKVLFSFNDQTKLGQIIEEILYTKIDLELLIQKAQNGSCQVQMQRCKKEYSNIVLFSDNKEIVDFHEYIFKKDEKIHLSHIQQWDKKSEPLLADADIVVFNLSDIKLKDNLLGLIKKWNLRAKFLLLSDEKIIRKRDQVSKREKGIFQVFQKDLDLTGYIYTIEKIIGRKFYTTTLNQVNIVPQNRLVADLEEFKNIIYNYSNYYIYFSVVSVEYQNENLIENSVLDKVVRDHDIVYHDLQHKSLTFILVDMLPEHSAYLIIDRLKEYDIQVISESSFCVSEFIVLMGLDLKSTDQEDISFSREYKHAV